MITCSFFDWPNANPFEDHPRIFWADNSVSFESNKIHKIRCFWAASCQGPQTLPIWPIYTSGLLTQCWLKRILEVEVYPYQCAVVLHCFPYQPVGLLKNELDCLWVPEADEQGHVHVRGWLPGVNVKRGISDHQHSCFGLICLAGVKPYIDRETIQYLDSSIIMQYQTFLRYKILKSYLLG